MKIVLLLAVDMGAYMDKKSCRYERWARNKITTQCKSNKIIQKEMKGMHLTYSTKIFAGLGQIAFRNNARSNNEEKMQLKSYLDKKIVSHDQTIFLEYNSP